MKTQAANVFARVADAVKIAVEYDRLGDVVLRTQTIRQMYDLPVSVAYVKAALRNAGLPTR